MISHSRYLNLSVRGEYALLAIFDLALHPGPTPVRIAEIARRHKIPKKFLELILAGLKRGGFVESRRGAEGGYLLAREAEKITVGEVLRFVEGSKKARKRGDTPFGNLWKRVDDSVGDIVDTLTFADLARAWRERTGGYTPDWEI